MRRAISLITLLLATVAHADQFDIQAKKLQQSAIIVDGHLDAPMSLKAKWRCRPCRGI